MPFGCDVCGSRGGACDCWYLSASSEELVSAHTMAVATSELARCVAYHRRHGLELGALAYIVAGEAAARSMPLLAGDSGDVAPGGASGRQDGG